MSVLNQMLRDLETRGVSAVPVVEAALPRPATLMRNSAGAGAGDRGTTGRRLLWLGTAVLVAVIVSIWSVLEHRVSEARHAPQPLGLQQFGNAINVNQSAQPAPAVAMPAVATTVTNGATNAVTNAPANAANSANAAMPISGSTASSSTTAVAASSGIVAPSGVSIEPGRVSGAAAALSAARSVSNEGTFSETGGDRVKATGTAGRAQPLRSKNSLAAQPRAPKAIAARSATSVAASAAQAPSTGAAPGSDNVAPLAVVRATDADIARAAELIARGRNSEATTVLERVLAVSPQHVAARQALAALLAESGQRARALVVLLDGAEIDAPHFASATAQLQFESGDTRGALATLARIPAAQRSGQHDALAAGISFATGMFAEAVASYERAVRTANAPAIWWVGLGLSYEAAGQRGDAREVFTRLANATALPSDIRSFVNDKITALAPSPAAARTAHPQSNVAIGAAAQ